MKSLRYLLGALAIFSASFAQAENACCPQECNPCCPNPCDECCDWGGKVYVDLLYWKACRAELDAYEIEDSEGRLKLIEPDLDLGWRVGGVFTMSSCKRWDFGVRYTSYNTSESKKIPEPYEIEDDIFTSARYEIDLDVVDIEAGYTFKCGCDDAIFRPFMGVKLAWVEEKVRSFGDDNFNRKLDSDGYGIYLGSSFDLPLACDFSVITRGAISILDSSFTQKRIRPFFSDGSDRVKDECLYTPVIEAFIGLGYSSDCFSCGTAHFAIGYETQWYGWREINSFDDVTFLGFGGLTARLGFGF